MMRNFDFSCIGSAQFLGFSTDFYKYGTQLMLVVVVVALACSCVAMIFIPVLYELNTISSYEYFNLRFNNVVRTFGSFLFVLKMVILLNYRPLYRFHSKYLAAFCFS